MDKVKIGIIGCGDIADNAYVTGCRQFDILDLVACADLVPEKAEALAAKHELIALTVDEMLADPAIQIILNLTIPAAHAQVSLAAIAADKHVYSEKPLAVDRASGAAILAAARERGVLVGCAPDTFLGGGQQTCRKLIDDGWIGTPVAATAFMMSPGHENWHPNAEFYYQPGGGPMMDMGPYYLTALINLLGAVERVSGTTRMTYPERTFTSEARYGDRIQVEVDTHVTGLLNFTAGPVATIITSFDVWYAELPRIEIYGSTGTLSVPDPNIFGGAVRVRRAGAADWSQIPLTHSHTVGRGIGIADMAYALQSGRPHRANGDLAYHVLDIMQAFQESSDRGEHIQINDPCLRPEALPLGLVSGTLDR